MPTFSFDVYSYCIALYLVRTINYLLKIKQQKRRSEWTNARNFLQVTSYVCFCLDSLQLTHYTSCSTKDLINGVNKPPMPNLLALKFTINYFSNFGKTINCVSKCSFNFLKRLSDSADMYNLRILVAVCLKDPQCV